MSAHIRIKEGKKWTKVARWQKGKDGAVIYSIGPFNSVARKGSWMTEDEYDQYKQK